MRVGRSGYLRFVATYIIDVNVHCWPFIKTPPYIRSTPLEDFIPPCSRRARTLFPRSLSTSSPCFLLLNLFSSSSYSPPTLCMRFIRSPPSPSKSSVSVVETHIATSRRSSWSSFSSDACSLSLSSSFFLFPRINFLSWAYSHFVVSSQRIRTFSFLVPDVSPSCQPAFSSSSLFVLSFLLLRRPRTTFSESRSSKRGRYCYRSSIRRQ